MDTAISEETRCQYPSKRCDNMRSLKISGDLHRFCLFHRCRANDAQRRWTKRKMEEGDAVTPTRRNRATSTSPDTKPKSTIQHRRSTRPREPTHAPYAVSSTHELPIIVPRGQPQELDSLAATTLDWLTEDLFQLIDKATVAVDTPQWSEQSATGHSYRALLQQQHSLKL